MQEAILNDRALAVMAFAEVERWLFRGAEAKEDREEGSKHFLLVSCLLCLWNHKMFYFSGYFFLWAKLEFKSTDLFFEPLVAQKHWATSVIIESRDLGGFRFWPAAPFSSPWLASFRQEPSGICRPSLAPEVHHAPPPIHQPASVIVPRCSDGVDLSWVGSWASPFSNELPRDTAYWSVRTGRCSTSQLSSEENVQGSLSLSWSKVDEELHFKVSSYNWRWRTSPAEESSHLKKGIRNEAKKEGKQIWS